MPINLPNLDDRTFADLVEEAQALIPVYEPRWTNHNASDPGITLVELFAYLSEMLMYRLNRVTDANVCAFLKLIDGIERIPSRQNQGMVCRIGGDENATSDKARSVYLSLRNLDPVTCEDFVSLAQAADPLLTVTEVALNNEVRNVVLNLREQDRAVTCADFERLSLAADPQVKRAHCVPQRDLTKANLPDRTKIAEADVSVVIVPSEITVLSFDGKTFTDVTGTRAEGGAAIPLLPPTNSDAGQLLYVGLSATFDSLSFILGETGAGYELVFKYFDGNQNDWIQLTSTKHNLVDNTSNWASSGLVTFMPPPDWKPAVVGGINQYWISISTSKPPTKTAVATQLVLDLTPTVALYLEPRRLLAARVHVVAPRFVTVAVHANLTLKADAVPTDVDADVRERLTQLFSPLGDGQDYEGWPFGRDVYVSEVYQLLDRTPGVDFVTRLEGLEILSAPDDAGGERLIPPNPPAGELVAIKLYPDELANLNLDKSDIKLVSPVDEEAKDGEP
ncbi:MAG TPA: baseplate J/gp47 family protein [Pyrinomonadaceae bacterium]|nr:baseplate J/gp47 family protein [Pyrinomonadaceae bacterium]